jgi:hypothetical protein
MDPYMTVKVLVMSVPLICVAELGSKPTQPVIDPLHTQTEFGQWDDGVPIFGSGVIELLSALACDPANGLCEIGPGMYQGPKAP